jgi:hypothetical protein
VSDIRIGSEKVDRVFGGKISVKNIYRLFLQKKPAEKSWRSESFERFWRLGYFGRLFWLK